MKVRFTEVVVLVAAACASTPVTAGDEPTPSDPARREALSRVVVGDGVSRAEAEAIAAYYFHDVVGTGCGALGDVEDGGGSWRFPARVGYAGARDGDILVSKVDGSVKWAGHPTVADPLSMLDLESAPKPTPERKSKCP